MGWFLKAKKDYSWRGQTLDSLAVPPRPLMVFFGVLLLLLYLATHSDYKDRVEKRRSRSRFSLLFLPLLVVVAVNLFMLRHRMLRYKFGDPRPLYHAAVTEEASSASGLLLVLLLLLVLVHYHSSFQSSWFRLF